MPYPMRLDAVWWPLLALFGGTSGRAFVDVEAERVRFRFGWSFDVTVPRSEIVAVQRVDWPVLLGIGRGAGAVGAERGRFRLGWSFDVTVPRSEIVAVQRVDWPVLLGIGWRIGPLDRVGLI